MNITNTEIHLTVTRNEETGHPIKSNTMKKQVETNTVYIRRFGVVSESSKAYESSNMCNCVESVRAACNELLQIDTYSHEVFVVLSLDKKCRLNAATIITQGTLDASLVHAREVFQTAILNNAASIILVHNHPSGDATPSKEDIEVTRRIIEAGRLLQIPVTDHVILGAKNFKGDNLHSVRRTGILAFD